MHRMKTMRAALLGGGMYGGDVLLRTLADLARCEFQFDQPTRQ